MVFKFDGGESEGESKDKALGLEKKRMYSRLFRKMGRKIVGKKRKEEGVRYGSHKPPKISHKIIFNNIK